MALLRVVQTLSPKGREAGLAGWHATSVPTWWLCVPTGIQAAESSPGQRREDYQGPSGMKSATGLAAECSRRLLTLEGMQVWFFCRD